METPTTPEAVAQTPQTSPPPTAEPTQQQSPVAASPPSDPSTLPSTPPESDTRPDPSRPTIDLPATATLDEIIASIPADVAASLTPQDVDALAKGDPKAVARVLNQPLQATPSQPVEEQVAPETKPDPEGADDKGINRISLRGLSTKDQKSVANAIAAVKEGKFGSIDEALIELAKTAPAAEPEAVTAESPQAEVSPKVAEIQQKLADIETKQQEAAESFDTATVMKLSREYTALSLDLRDAQAEQKQAQSANQSWASQEAQHLESVKTTYATDFADPAFSEAFADARDLAELRNDPILNSPDWSVRLAAKVKGKLSGRPAPQGQPAPQAPIPAPPVREAQVRGAMEQPSTTGTPTMTVNEAMAALDDMSEEQIDAVLAATRQKEAAARLRR